uniref:NADH-ubiquinone oxidoreductase chain 5 n=1 Tax=Hydromanicus wulaianus TaxID=1435189 RepID=A0A342CFI3_9NEOP|nr:NADH dehydrogenase subunit 5 [Hydromanicus wulaianus]AHC32059.1 NADH dehydrogenase subunit 5 [Hydromanicus wulaianus]
MDKKLDVCVISMIILFSMSLVSFLMSVYFISINYSLFIEWEMFSLNSSMVIMLIYLDWMSFFFFFIVMLISSMVIFYSKSYMSMELNLMRFIVLILLFVLSMVLLIFSLNLISILLGWDGLGLVSFCLVIYYQNVKSLNSGMLTILSNRIGDVLILMAIVWMVNYGSWNFLPYMKIMVNSNLNFMILMFIILAAMTKSAQIPFSAWLPAAMAAPTPVSALVHSSTLVTAGVYLLIRFIYLGGASTILNFLLIMSSLTMLMAGMSANFEIDLKKIIALSTLSQLGLMMSILCLGFKSLTFFHLCTHAIFKALLFMCAGMIIHNMKDNQDIRLMGGVGNFMPLVFINFNISNLALCGMPFLAGFYSKDLILEMVYFSNVNMIVFFFFFFSTGLTVSYTVRLIYLGFLKEMSNLSLFSFHDNDKIMILSMFSLLMISIMGGSMMGWLILPKLYFMYLFGINKFMVLIFIFMGFMLGMLMGWMNILLKKLFLMKIYYFMSLMWFIPAISVYGLNNVVLKMSLKLDKVMDLGWMEKVGSLGMYQAFMKFAKLNYYLQINSFKLYMFMFFTVYLLLILI